MIKYAEKQVSKTNPIHQQIQLSGWRKMLDKTIFHRQLYTAAGCYNGSHKSVCYDEFFIWQWTHGSTTWRQDWWWRHTATTTEQ